MNQINHNTGESCTLLLEELEVRENGSNISLKSKKDRYIAIRNFLCEMSNYMGTSPLNFALNPFFPIIPTISTDNPPLHTSARVYKNTLY